jgi:hypothetical protein
MTGVGNMTDIAITDTDTPLDGRTDIVLHLEQAEVYLLMLLAHERDITLNQFVEDILRQFIEEHKNGNK